ncbi:17436_t:CDS:1, partial [Dentiscutata erythropus]
GLGYDYMEQDLFQPNLGYTLNKCSELHSKIMLLIILQAVLQVVLRVRDDDFLR